MNLDIVTKGDCVAILYVGKSSFHVSVVCSASCCICNCDRISRSYYNIAAAVNGVTIAEVVLNVGAITELTAGN